MVSLLIKSIKFLISKLLKLDMVIFIVVILILPILFGLIIFLYNENKNLKKEIKLTEQVLMEKEKIEKILTFKIEKCNENYEILYNKYDNLINDIKRKEIEMSKKLKEYIEKEKLLNKIHEKYKIEIDKTKNECENMKELIKKFEEIN